MLRFTLCCLVLVIACGDDSSPTDASTQPDVRGFDGGDDFDAGPAEPDAGSDNGVSGDEVYMGSCADPGCGGIELESACTCVPSPSDEAALTLNRVGCGQLESGGGDPRNFDDDFCDEDSSDATPVLGCTTAGMYRPTGTPETATVYGVIDVFGNGGDADNLTVEVCVEGPDGMPIDCLPAATALTSDACSETEIQYENDVAAGERELGFWSVANVPTETPLIIHTSGDPHCHPERRTRA